jgi:cbb3-type cytochrome oxidase subunit 3
MLSFIKHHFDTIEGIGIYQIIATLIFLGVFVSMVVYAFVLKKNYMKENAELPLDENDDNLLNNN